MRHTYAETLAVDPKIGSLLKEYFNELVSKEIPPRFLELLKRLENNNWTDREAQKNAPDNGIQKRTA